MRISDWSSDVCSSDLIPVLPRCCRRRMDAGALGVDRLCHGGSKVTEKPGPDRKLAIALENVTPEAVAAKGADPAVPGQPGPRVVASGRGAVAEPILQIAFERGVKVRSEIGREHV